MTLFGPSVFVIFFGGITPKYFFVAGYVIWIFLANM